MASFRKVSNHSQALSQIKLQCKEQLSIHLAGVRAKATSDIKLVIKGAPIEALLVATPHSKTNGIWEIKLTSNLEGESLLSAVFRNRTVATIQISSFEKKIITLPDPYTDRGLLCRLLLVNSIPPSNIRYNEQNSIKAMRWIKYILQKRINSPDFRRLGAKKKIDDKPQSLFDVVNTGGEFKGFENYPKLEAHIKLTISNCLSIANNHAHPAYESYVVFVENVLNTASEINESADADPVAREIIAWGGVEEPLRMDEVVPYQELEGKVFYRKNAFYGEPDNEN